MDTLERFGVSIPGPLLHDFDKAIARANYANRSEAIRDLIRNYLVREQWDTPDAEVVGTLTLVYDHHTHDLEDVLTEMQHRHCEAIVCSTHVHLDAHNCLEVVIVRGSSAEVRAIANSLLSTRGVKHGGLTATATGEHF